MQLDYDSLNMRRVTEWESNNVTVLHGKLNYGGGFLGLGEWEERREQRKKEDSRNMRES